MTSLVDIINPGSLISTNNDNDPAISHFSGRILTVEYDTIVIDPTNEFKLDHKFHIQLPIHFDISNKQGRYKLAARFSGETNHRGVTFRILRKPEPVEEREYVRTNCMIPVTWKPIKESEVLNYIARIYQKNEERRPVDPILRTLRSEGDEALADLFSILFNRLDRMEYRLDQMWEQKNGGIIANNNTDTVRNISGSGVYIISKNLNKQHVFLELNFYLTEICPTQLSSIVRVVRTTSPHDSHLRGVGGRFEAISEADREAIIRYTFQLQREKLRRKLR